MLNVAVVAVVVGMVVANHMCPTGTLLMNPMVQM
jgi:hypothetical protein